MFQQQYYSIIINHKEKILCLSLSYFNCAFLFFSTDNLDLAKADLQNCIEIEENRMYYYGIGVIYGYLLDYPSAIQSFETALSVGIPISERGLVISTLTMTEGYLGEWMYSLLK